MAGQFGALLNVPILNGDAEGVRLQVTAPPSLERLARRVDERLALLFDGELTRWSEVDQALRLPLEDLKDFALRGGKRLRPAFCYWAFVGAGGDPADLGVLDASAALELLHCFALIHDDVMDGSPLRRGEPAIHVKYRDDHRAEDRFGESRRFGDGVAVLIGDLAFVYADQLMESANLTARSIFTELRLEVNFGQYLDVFGTSTRSTDPEFARRISIYKSGKYTVERPLLLGAALAENMEPFASALSTYGMALGEAFQLRDDLLGIFGESEITGKPVGEDIREGKPTLIYALAHRDASPAQRAIIEGSFGVADASEDAVLAVQEVFAETGAIRSVEARVDCLVEESISALRGSALAPEAALELERLAYYIGSRRT